MKGVPLATTYEDSENIKPKNDNPSGDWTIVASRRGKQRQRNHPKIGTIDQQPWAPADSGTDPEKEMKLMQKMQICIQRLENSDFFRTFLEQMQTPQVCDSFSMVLATESKMQMVIYGIGSIDSYEPPRLQLSLAILIKRRSDWIGDIEVFDPVLSKTESKILEALGCFVLSVNEQGRRLASKPTMFFMPHCEVVLYDNLLEANWRPELLIRMVVFGNSFLSYKKYISDFKNASFSFSAKHVLAACRFSTEVEVETVSDYFFRAFHDSSWHFFHMNPEMELELHSLKL